LPRPDALGDAVDEQIGDVVFREVAACTPGTSPYEIHTF
jgi:hypothetical protein